MGDEGGGGGGGDHQISKSTLLHQGCGKMFCDGGHQYNTVVVRPWQGTECMCHPPHEV